MGRAGTSRLLLAENGEAISVNRTELGLYMFRVLDVFSLMPVIAACI